MGASPIALFSDIHVADDGDVGKIFDHIAGISAIAELTRVPLITGSTLRIGGDMVIGERMTGGVGAVGIAHDLTARVNAEAGDVILMTEGAGGGTISTAALYYGMHDVVDETINITFINACEALIAGDLLKGVHAMTDVTNGGIRGDANEISRTARVKLVFFEEKMRALVNPKVLSMLESLEIDYLGVSLDALLMIAPPDAAHEILNVIREEKMRALVNPKVLSMLESLGIDYLGVSLDALLMIAPPDAAHEILNVIREQNIRIDVVGEVCEGEGTELTAGGEVCNFEPRFRESAYTPIKKLVGDTVPEDYERMRNAVDLAASASIRKKRRVVERILGISPKEIS